VKLHVKHSRVLQSDFRKPCAVIWLKINLDIIGSQPDQYHGDTFTRKFKLRLDSPNRTAILPIIEIYERLPSHDNDFVIAWSGAAQMAAYGNHQVRLGKYTASICDCPDDFTKTVTPHNCCECLGKIIRQERVVSGLDTLVCHRG